MGTDIHAAIEYRENGIWKAITHKNEYFGRWEGEEEYTARMEFGRNYNAFAILADVRNGCGFAGIPTGKGFIPISLPKGIPGDVSPEALQALSQEHTPTYVTLEEILKYDWTQITTHIGCVDAVTYAKLYIRRQWDTNASPEGWSGSVSGGGTEIIEESAMLEIMAKFFPNRNWQEYHQKLPELEKSEYTKKYCYVEWDEDYASASGSLWSSIVPKLLKLGAKYGYENVRMIMDFDS